MPKLGMMFSVWSVLATPVVLVGLCVRRFYKHCFSLFLYLTCVWLYDALSSTWPNRFWTWEFWTLKETIYLTLKLIMVLELSRRVFRSFPGALRVSERALLLACVAILGVLLVNLPTSIAGLQWIWLSVGPWVQHGTAALFILLWVLLIWYRIPTHALHRGIIRGFAIYLLVNAIVLAAIARFIGGEPMRTLGVGVPWMVLLAYWSWLVWRAPDWKPTLANRSAVVQPIS
jgi:hypothetical protein